MTEQMTDLLQRMDSYVRYPAADGRQRSCWLRRVRVNPLRQLWVMEFFVLEEPDEAALGEMQDALQKLYRQELELRVRTPKTPEEAAVCWPLWVEAIDADFHPADPQVGELEAVTNPPCTADGRRLTVQLHPTTNLRHGEELQRLLAEKISAVLGSPVEVAFAGGAQAAPEAAPAEKKAPKAEKKEAPKAEKREPKAPAGEEGELIYGRTIRDEPIPIGEVSEETGRVAVEGVVFQQENRQLKSGKYLFTFAVTDYTGSISAKLFLDEKNVEEITGKIKNGKWLRIGGDCQYDS